MNDRQANDLKARAPLILFLLASSCYLYLFLANFWVSEDALISLNVVHNFRSGNGLVYNPGERVQVYTHPLWLACLIVSGLLVGNSYLSIFVLHLLVNLGLLWVLHRTFRDLVFASLAVMVLAFCQPFINYSSSGLENSLSVLLIALLFLAQGRRGSGRIVFGLAALLFLNRMDLILIALPVMAVRIGRDRDLRKGILWFGAPVLLYLLFSVVYYGFPFPNTFYAKLTTGLPKMERYVQGLYYCMDTFRYDALAFLLVLTPLIVSFSMKKYRIFGAGLLLYLLYIVSIGGDYQVGRFFTPPILLGCLILFRTMEDFSVPPSISAAVSVVLIALGMTLSEDIFAGSDLPMNMNRRLIIDEKRHLKEWSLVELHRLNPIMGEMDNNYRHREQLHYMDTGCGIKGLANKNRVLIDVDCLASPLLSRLPARPDYMWMPGHVRRFAPVGYRRYLESGDADVLPEDLRPYVRALEIITKGRPFSLERLKTILLFNAGHYDRCLVEYLEDGYYIGNAHEVIDYDDFHDRRTDPGAHWNAPGNIVIGSNLLIRDFPVEGERAGLSIAVDSNDFYVLTPFDRHFTMLGRVVIVPSRNHPGLKVVEADLGDFSHLHIEALQGDGLYSVGHCYLIDS